MRHRSLFILLILTLAGTVEAQEYSALDHGWVFGRSTGVPEFGEDGELALAAEAVFYFKNLELFNLEEILGETFTGYRAPVTARYKAHEQVGVEVGVLLGHEFGDDDHLDRVAPIVRVVFEPSPDLHFIGGTVVPTHWMHDAMLDDTRKLRMDVEQGFQLRADRRVWKHDTWLDWRIREGEDRAEEFEIGLTNQFRILQDALRLDTQFLWTHAGGQMSASDRIEQNLLYLAGFSTGVRNPFGRQRLEEVRAGYAWLYSRDETDRTDLFKGYGRSYTARADVRINTAWRVRLFGEIFDGDRFTATLGDPLYRLDSYDQIGTSMLFVLADGGLQVEVGFVSQATADQNNLTYQLAMAWNDIFTLLR